MTVQKAIASTCLLVGALLIHASVAQAKLIAPATLQDIVDAIGPDAKGLNLTQESLPDMFTLSASRIDEDSTKFIVQQPYTSGRWQGGKAVIEYARDLSYTLVNVYDKEGRRQRIYSVIAKHSTRKEEPRPVIASRPSAPAPRETSPREASPTAPPAVQALPETKPAAAESQAHITYEWDDEKNAYVPTAESSELLDVAYDAAAAPVPQKAVTAAARQDQPPVVSRAQTPPPSAEEPPVRRQGTRPSKPARPAVQAPAASRESTSKVAKAAIKVGNTTWVERNPDEPAKVEEPAEPPPVIQKPSRRTAAKEKRDTPRESAPPVPVVVATAKKTPPPPPEPVDLHPVPQTDTRWVETIEKAREERKQASQPPEPAPAAMPVTAPTPPAPTPKAKAAVYVPSTEELLASAPTTSKAAPKDVIRNAAPAPVQESSPVPPKPIEESRVPSTEELLANEPEPTPQAAKAASKPAPAPTIVPEVPVKVAKATPPAEVPVQAPSRESVVPSTEELLAHAPEPTGNAPVAAPYIPPVEDVTSEKTKPTGPDTSGADAWVPKALPKAAELPDTDPKNAVQLAMTPKPRGPVDNSVEALLAMAADKGKGQIPHEGDAWVPKNAVPKKPDVDLEKEVARLREKEKLKQAQKTVAPVHMDVNNPEEGVLPVSTFEKFSGPMYGRHREYERRFFPGRKPKSKAPPHDFYVDEVDRKKEIHNIYYYSHQKGKAPKVIAVERHENVTFLGNYDIDKEGKSKIKVY